MEDTPESTHGNAPFFFVKQSPSVSCTTSYGLSHMSGHEDGFHFRCLSSHVLVPESELASRVPSSATVITRFLQVSASFQSGLLPEDPPPAPSPSPEAKTLSGQQRVCSANILSLRIRCGSDWKRPTQALAPRSPGNPSTCRRNREKLASCDHSPTARGLHVLWTAAFYSAAVWNSSHKPLGSQASRHRPQEPGGTGLGGQALGQSSGAWTPQEGGSSDTSQNISWKVGIFLQV